MGTLAMYNVLGIAARLDVPILQASTSEIYGDPSEHPQKESYLGNVNPIGPRACYDEGKRVAEALCIGYEANNNVKIRIARIFNTYGRFMDPDDGRVVSNFVVQALKGKPITVYGDGSQTRSFCFVDDMVNGLIKLLHSDYNRPVNLGNPDEYSMINFAKIVNEMVNGNSKIIFEGLPEDDPKKRCPDISLAKEILQWEPKYSLQEGLGETIEWYRKVIDE